MNIKGQGHSLALVQGHSVSSFSNFFFLETARSIDVKFHVKPPWDRGTKIYSNGLGHLTIIASNPIYGANLKKIFFSGTKKLMNLKVGKQHQVLEYTKFVQLMTLG